MAENQSKTLLFLSADIVRSTEYKSQRDSPAGVAEWLATFQRFFSELPLVFMGQVAVAFAAEPDLPEVRLWKVGGDEVLFLAEVRELTECGLLVEAFCHTITRCEARFEAEQLRLHGCVWGAQFPHPNAEIEIPEMAAASSASGSVYRDYLGPEVDTGFRLAKSGAAGEVVVSLNVALPLGVRESSKKLMFFTRGCQRLEGLFSGVPYPILIAKPMEREQSGFPDGAIAPEMFETLAHEFQGLLRNSNTPRSTLRLF